MGADGAGIVCETGEEVVIVPSLWWGDRNAAPGPGWQILGDHQPGTYAELVHVPADAVAPKPRGWSWPEAAAFPLVGLTVYRALFIRAGLREGESLLILGASGGVATAAVALGSAVGADVVVTSSSADKADAAKALGARDAVLYSDKDWPRVARALTPQGEGFDVILDSVGDWSNAIDALRPGGRLVVLGASRASWAELDIRRYYFGQYTLLGTTMGSARDYQGLVEFMSRHSVRPPTINRVFPLDQAAQAHEYMESGAGIGKIILDTTGGLS
jgi:NADPH:quinone reductase-like Zn-dependent oxidoreductase